mmetsp:Transcript_8789/g.23733  ORF Transcript_8789/g.23733 Transcript_8789/m.23733 type:complete len:150 (+) Transcript_8789:1677-2126(+)
MMNQQPTQPTTFDSFVETKNLTVNATLLLQTRREFANSDSKTSIPDSGVSAIGTTSGAERAITPTNRLPLPMRQRKSQDARHIRNATNQPRTTNHEQQPRQNQQLTINGRALDLKRRKEPQPTNTTNAKQYRSLSVTATTRRRRSTCPV